jgi:hypothetical protein
VRHLKCTIAGILALLFSGILILAMVNLAIAVLPWDFVGAKFYFHVNTLLLLLFAVVIFGVGFFWEFHRISKRPQQ